MVIGGELSYRISSDGLVATNRLVGFGDNGGNAILGQS